MKTARTVEEQEEERKPGETLYTLQQVASLVNRGYNTVHRDASVGRLEVVRGRMEMARGRPRELLVRAAELERYRELHDPDPRRVYLGYVRINDAARLSGRRAQQIRQAIWYGTLPGWQRKGSAGRGGEGCVAVADLARWMRDVRTGRKGWAPREFVRPVESVPVIMTLDDVERMPTRKDSTEHKAQSAEPEPSRSEPCALRSVLPKEET